MIKVFIADQEHGFLAMIRHPARRQSRTDPCETEGLAPLSSVLKNRWLMLILVSFTLLSGCRLGEIIGEVGREYLSFSVLAINLQGIHQEYGDDRVRWQDRYGRIGSWMATTKKIPDLIALQEVHGRSGDVKDYDTIFALITKIQEQTNISYRIAYLAVRPVPQGFRPTLWAGNALLYNPDRLTNKTLSSPRRVPSNFDDESVLGVHPRKSLPCQSPSETFQALCSLIDGDGLAWVSSYRGVDGRWQFGPVFAWFELKRSQGSHIHIYNVHVQWQQGEDVRPATYLTPLQGLVSESENRLASARLYPPVILGDFNLGENDVLSHLTDFEIAGYASRDVMGVLIGKQSTFPSKQRAYFEHFVAPEDVEDPATRGTATCGRVGELWSDHCAVFVQFSPIP